MFTLEELDREITGLFKWGKTLNHGNYSFSIAYGDLPTLNVRRIGSDLVALVTLHVDLLDKYKGVPVKVAAHDIMLGAVNELQERERQEKFGKVDKSLDAQMAAKFGASGDAARDAKERLSYQAALEGDAASITGVKGLPIAGYAKTQPPEVIAASQELKYAEERFYRLVEKHLAELGADGRDTALAKTYAQIAFSTAVRALMKPQRIDLPEDGEKPVDHGQIDMEASRGGTGEE